MSNAICLLPFLGVLAAGADWSQFRGPNGSGVDSAAGYPVEFSPAKNVVWKKSVPYGQSSPVVAANRLYFTASEGDLLLTLCLDARSGRELWRREIRRERQHKTFKANDPASPTPAVDESGVVVFFPDFGLAAYTPEGQQLWSLALGPFKNFYGMASSPVLAGNLVILVCDQQSGSFMLALDRQTGRRRWRTDRPGTTIGWATPMVFRPPRGPAQLVVLGSTRLDSYYLDTGERRWWMPIGSMGAIGVPVADGETLLVSSLGSNEPWMPSFASALEKYDKDKDGRLSQPEFSEDKDLGEHFGWLDDNGDNFISAQEWNSARNMGAGEYGLVALRPGEAQGQLDPGAVLWRFKKNLPYIPAPLVYQGVAFMVRDGGIITAIDSASGRLLKEGRSREALGEYYASPVAADNKLFLASSEGKITVLKSGGAWELLGVNDLGEEVHATPALSQGRVFVRTRSSIYCFGAAGR